MARSDLVKLAEKELRPYGIGPRDLSTKSIGMEAYELIWTHNGQPHRIHLPRDSDNKREIAIFRSNLEKQLREFGVKLLDPSASRIDIEEQIEEIRGELVLGRERHSSIEEMFLEWAAEQENKLKAFAEDLSKRLANQDVLIAAALQKQTTAIAAEPAPKVQPTAPLPVQKAPLKPEPRKGLEDLEAVRKQKWAQVVAEIDAEFEFSDVEGRILYFLYKCGPQTPTDLRAAGVWRSTDSATRFLDDMETQRLVRFLVAERKWAITNEGIAALDEGEPEEETHPSAFEKIEEGLTEALAYARGEPNHAKTVRVHVPTEQPAATPKPTLTVVPSGPRILKPVKTMQDSMFTGLSFVEKSMVALLERDMTIVELQKAIGHTSSCQSLASMLYTSERKNGYVKYFYEQGKVYRITDQGRAYINRIAPGCKAAG